MIRFPRVLAAALAVTLLLAATCAMRRSHSRQHRGRRGRRQPARCRQDTRREPQTGGNSGVHRREARGAGCRAVAGRRLFHAHIQQGRGHSGHVYALVPAPLADAPADAPDFAARVKAIAADPNYSNVSVVVEPFSQLAVPVPVDLVWTSQNYHDLHNFPGLDVGVFNKMVFDDLKPGGIYLDPRPRGRSGVRRTGYQDLA